MPMSQTLADVIRHCRLIDELIISTETGTFTITADGQLEGLTGEYLVGQWLQLENTKLSDGLYRINAIDAISGAVTLSNGTDTEMATQGEEAFTGVVRGLRISPALLAITCEILAYNEGAGAASPYVSETVLNVHSWSKGAKSNGAPVTWVDVFHDKLLPFMRLPIPAVKI